MEAKVLKMRVLADISWDGQHDWKIGFPFVGSEYIFDIGSWERICTHKDACHEAKLVTQTDLEMNLESCDSVFSDLSNGCHLCPKRNMFDMKGFLTQHGRSGAHYFGAPRNEGNTAYPLRSA
eukprot:1620298-Amphidinium_carterae.1